MNPFLTGAVAGGVATLPMTFAMNRMRRKLPDEQQYPLPPRVITEQVVRTANMGWVLSEPEVKGLTLVAHYGYGASMGVVYAMTQQVLPEDPLVKGMVFGVAVWAGSYLGCRPILRPLRSALRQPPERHALMIAAHLVWGGVLGLLHARFERSPSRSRS
jgi:uncharacterized membrane protein YagU involved in acid resistance